MYNFSSVITGPTVVSSLYLEHLVMRSCPQIMVLVLLVVYTILWKSPCYKQSWIFRQIRVTPHRRPTFTSPANPVNNSNPFSSRRVNERLSCVWNLLVESEMTSPDLLMWKSFGSIPTECPSLPLPRHAHSDATIYIHFHTHTHIILFIMVVSV